MQPTHTIKVSAILPNYNNAEFLSKSIQSLLDQSEPLTEIIIVDDGSTDNSLEVIESFMNKHHTIRLIQHEKNRGVNPALNTGIENATGDYVILCAADDWYGINMVALAKQAIRKHPRAGLICGDAIVSRFDMKASFKRILPYGKKNDWITPDEFQFLARQGFVCFNSGGSMLIKRQAILEAGMLYPEVRWHGDWLLYFLVALQHGIYYIDEVFIHINMRKSSYSENKSQWNVQKQVIHDTLHILYKHHPIQWNHFKQAALLPHYSLRYLHLFILDPVMRRYLSWQLVWKLFINNRFVIRVGRFFPYPVILKVRKLLRA